MATLIDYSVSSAHSGSSVSHSPQFCGFSQFFMNPDFCWWRSCTSLLAGDSELNPELEFYCPNHHFSIGFSLCAFNLCQIINYYFNFSIIIFILNLI